MASPATYRFDRYTLDPARRRLSMDDGSVALTGRAFDLLVALVERRGEVVSRHALMELVWPDVVVEESNLHVQIGAVRRAIGRAAIATVPGRGYAFALDVAIDGGVVRADGAPARAPADPLAGNLPSAPSRLFGRDADLVALDAALGESGVVTVTGPGGIGKTRVAAAAAWQVRSRYADGAWWVELAGVGDRRDVAPAVGRALGIARADARLEADDVARGLRGRTLLLVLDNGEHVLDAVEALLAALRRDAPGVAVLVTSQEPVGLADEVVHRLGGLDVPASTAPGDVAAAGASALFVARARAVDRRFVLTDDNAAAVREVVARLDGIPLAIELAAARLPLLGLEGVRSRLQARFDVLAGGPRGRPRRQQTLRAALDWSHALLTADEQALFRRLSVFVGGFTLEAAQAVGAVDGCDALDVLEHLGGLVEKSLVIAEGEGTPRYRYLETARLFGLEALERAGETAACRRRHAERLRDHLRTAFEAVWASRQDLTIIPELDNARAALDWSVREGRDRHFALELHGYSFALWPRVVLAGEGIARCKAIRDWVDATTPAPVAARFWLALGYTGQLTTDAICLDAAEHAARAFAALGDDRRRFDALLAVGSIAAQRGAFDVARAAVTEADALVRADWPPTRLAILAYVAFELAYRSERFDEAAGHAERQAEWSRRVARPVGEALALGNQGTAEVWIAGRGDVGEARIRDAYQRLTAAGGAIHAGHMLLALAQSLVRRGELAEGLAWTRTAYALLKREDDQGRMKLGLLPLLAARMGRHELAARALGHALASDRLVTAEALRLQAAARRIVEDALPSDRFDRLLAEGRTWSEDDVFERVLASP